ncbi:MAG: putative metal-binding motif-containing protein, partial [Myxococcota bacterium]
MSCLAPAGHVLLGGDCNDGDDTIAPGIAEDPCDGIDNDCDNVIDFNVVPRDFA